MTTAQSYANHRAVPRITLVAGAILLADLVVRIVGALRGPSLAAAWAVLPAAALLVVFFNARRKAQIVQDRVIRLEMRLRLARVLPADRQAEIARLTLPQLVALRFAGDGELPELVARALGGAMPDALKQAVRDWQEDRLRV